MTTAYEFERSYAEASGVTLDVLHARGQFAMPADPDECSASECTGWHMERVGTDVHNGLELSDHPQTEIVASDGTRWRQRDRKHRWEWTKTT